MSRSLFWKSNKSFLHDMSRKPVIPSHLTLPAWSWNWSFVAEVHFRERRFNKNHNTHAKKKKNQGSFQHIFPSPKVNQLLLDAVFKCFHVHYSTSWNRWALTLLTLTNFCHLRSIKTTMSAEIQLTSCCRFNSKNEYSFSWDFSPNWKKHHPQTLLRKWKERHKIREISMLRLSSKLTAGPGFVSWSHHSLYA